MPEPHPDRPDQGGDQRSDQVADDIAALSDLTAAGIEVDGEVQVAESTWAIYGHTSYDGEIIVGEYHDAAEASEVLRAAPHPDPGRSNDMTDVTVTNRRAESSANGDLARLARHGADTFGYMASLRIERKLAQLLRLRVSQINNCAYCLNLHYEAARDLGIPRPVIDTLTAWWETDFHDDAARAALAYTESITRVADATVADDFGLRHDALAEHFSPEEILEIIGIVINMNVWTRLKLAEGATPRLVGQAMS